MRQVSIDRSSLYSSFPLVSIYHMRDLCCGNKKMLKNKEIKVISIPYYDGLTIKEMINWTQ